jgi:hypothetical protein
MATPVVTYPNSFLQTIDLGLRGLLFTKFKDILGLEDVNTGVLYRPKETALRHISEKKANTEVEFVNVWRTRTAPNWKLMRTPAARRGVMMEAVNEGTTDIAIVKMVPAVLEYDIWFWTKKLENLGLISEKYLFWQHQYPRLNLDLTLSYDAVETSYPVNPDLHFGDLVDESTLEEEYDKGMIYILRAPVTIDGWIPVASSLKRINKIVFTVYDGDDLQTDAQYREVIVEDSNQDVELEVALRLSEHEIE